MSVALTVDLCLKENFLIILYVMQESGLASA